MKSGDDKIDMWNYDECQLTYEEYAEYKKTEQSPGINLIGNMFSSNDDSTAAVLLNQMEILENQAVLDETMAEILLNQMEV